MRWVDQATVRPFRCAIIPYVGNGGGHSFIDTGQDLDLEHVYISDVAAQALASFIGYIPGSELAACQEQVVELKKSVEQLEGELAEADKFQEAIHVIESKEFSARKRPGRKPKAAA